MIGFDKRGLYDRPVLLKKPSKIDLTSFSKNFPKNFPGGLKVNGLPKVKVDGNYRSLSKPLKNVHFIKPLKMNGLQV